MKYKREMSDANINRAFNELISRKDFNGLYKFITYFPEFTDRHINNLYNQLDIIELFRQINNE